MLKICCAHPSNNHQSICHLTSLLPCHVHIYIHSTCFKSMVIYNIFYGLFHLWCRSAHKCVSVYNSYFILYIYCVYRHVNTMTMSQWQMCACGGGLDHANMHQWTFFFFSMLLSSNVCIIYIFYHRKYIVKVFQKHTNLYKNNN